MAPRRPLFPRCLPRALTLPPVWLRVPPQIPHGLQIWLLSMPNTHHHALSPRFQDTKFYHSLLSIELITSSLRCFTDCCFTESCTKMNCLKDLYAILEKLGRYLFIDHYSSEISSLPMNKHLIFLLSFLQLHKYPHIFIGSVPA